MLSVGTAAVALAICLSFQLNLRLALAEGDHTVDLPPMELFGGGRTQRLLWAEPNDIRLCLIDWSMPDTTNQPFGVRECAGQAEEDDNGEFWILGRKNSAANTTKDFEGMIGNAGTGRCMQWRPAPANKTWNPSPFKAVTYGNITSEPCDEKNEYQYFQIPNFLVDSSMSGLRPKAFKHRCPKDMHPTILTSRKRALVVYGCGTGEWYNWPVGVEFGWYYYNITSSRMELLHDGDERFDDIECCLGPDEFKKGTWCNSVYTQATKDNPMDWKEYWDGLCVGLFSNYIGYKGPWSDPG
ncbi:hypothetical protein TWF696_002039 [Orbilia brochopaga]|uniref:Uncharacterized protein n=1 Tax=Orbilia brochopaga TaxID=3140254 RepID=A0AAV9U850_9PEZI